MLLKIACIQKLPVSIKINTLIRKLNLNIWNYFSLNKKFKCQTYFANTFEAIKKKNNSEIPSLVYHTKGFCAYSPKSVNFTHEFATTELSVGTQSRRE